MPCPAACSNQAAVGVADCSLLISAYVLAGLAMMLNIRLSYSSAPYALIRFKLPENLFSVFVRRMASALELWCLPSMLLGNIMDLIQKLAVYPQKLQAEAGIADGEKLQAKAQALYTQAGSLDTELGQALGALGSAAGKDAERAAITEAKNKVEKLKEAASNSEPKGLKELLGELNGAKGFSQIFERAQLVQQKYEDVERKYNAVANDTEAKTRITGVKDAFNNLQTDYTNAVSPDKFHWIIIPSIVTQWLNFLTYVLLLVVYLVGGDTGRLTTFYFVIAISGVVFGINMTLVYSADFNYIPVYIAGENSFPALTSFIHYLATLMFGNRRKWNSDFIVVCVDIVVAIIISFVAAVVWTWAYTCSTEDGGKKNWWHIYGHGFSGSFSAEIISPFLMIVVGMGLVYAIYPGLAPGMIVPFYLIDKIEMVLLIATIFPPVIVAALRRSFSFGDNRSPMCKWSAGGLYTGAGSGLHWHLFDLLMVIKITLAYIFIYSLHYRDSNISRSIINQPKMSTFLSITFYMCHECLLALGFPGLVGANFGGDFVLIPQYIGALFMIFLAFYSEGYIIEYKSHDPAQWTTENCGTWLVCIWLSLG